jgi:hypothetical protein
MLSFGARTKAFEGQYSQGTECQFLINVRRNKLLGYWVADQLGLRGQDVENYARAVVVADFEEPGDDDVLRKVYADFQSHHHAMPREAIRRKMDQLMVTAQDEVLTDRESGEMHHELMMGFA